jgi:hypothetical protein
VAVCDICGAPGIGRVISSENVRQAVFGGGFNPFALGIAPNLTGASSGVVFAEWKRTVVAQDTSDWNICARCMTHLERYIVGETRAAGVANATVYTGAAVGAAAEAVAERKYRTAGTRAEATRPRGKRWWQYWRT